MRTARLLLVVAAAGCGSSGSAPAPPAPKGKQPVVWADAAAGVVVDGVRVRVTAAAVEPALAAASKPHPDGGSIIRVTLAVENTTDRKLEFKGWTVRPGPVEAKASLRDDAGKSYKHLGWDGLYFITGRAGDVTINPGESAADAVGFDPPAPRAVHLDLLLPGQNVGSAEVIRLRLPKSAWEKK